MTRSSPDTWEAEALRRFGPIPPGGGENTRLIAGYHYAFVEGAKAAAARSSAGSAIAALNEILRECDEAPTDNNAWVVAIQNIARAALQSPDAAQAPGHPADAMISQIEERFPNWKAYRDLLDCIDCTLHDLRGGR